jgi:AcrR family transcriptional regulator
MVNHRSGGRQHEASKARISGAALQLLTSGGLTNWSISGCAETANCAKGLVLHYFGTKESLLGAVAQELISRRAVEWRAALSGEGVGALDALWLALTAEAGEGRTRGILELRFAGISGAALSPAEVETLRSALGRALGTDATELPTSAALEGILEGYQLALMGSDRSEETREAFYRYWLTYVP